MHISIIDDDNVEVGDDVGYKSAVIDAFDDLRADTAAEFISFLNHWKFPEDLFRMVLGIIYFSKIFSQQQKQHFLD